VFLLSSAFPISASSYEEMSKTLALRTLAPLAACLPLLTARPFAGAEQAAVTRFSTCAIEEIAACACPESAGACFGLK
jgi:hypothetical protein